jgi:16S rRNA (cytidine1402-2'-O)-methyltransferase
MFANPRRKILVRRRNPYLAPMATGTLYLIPVPLIEEGVNTLPEYLITHCHELRYFVAERAKSARRFLKEIKHPLPMSEIEIQELNKHTSPAEIEGLLQPALDGHDLGVLSEAGCPGIADPGAGIVRKAHQKGIAVYPLIGPSSILLALMASGMNGQQFCFHGYLPPKKPELQRKLQQLEKQSAKFRQSQIFIETPYRNKSMIEACLKQLQPHTRFCIAADLTGPEQFIRTQTVAQWQKDPPPDLHKIPAVFIIGQ